MRLRGPAGTHRSSRVNRLIAVLVTIALVLGSFPCKSVVSLAQESDSQAAQTQAQASQAIDEGAAKEDDAQSGAVESDEAQTAPATQATQTATPTQNQTQTGQSTSQEDPEGSVGQEDPEGSVGQAQAGQAQAGQAQPAITDKPAITQITYENDDLVVTATETAAGVLPEGASLVVRELTPSSDGVQEGLKGSRKKAQDAQADIDAYVDAVSRVADQAQAAGKTVVSARAYDIQLLDAQGNEIEPQGQVKVSLTYKKKAELESAKPDSSNVEVAHVQDNGQVESVAAQIDSDAAGRIESADFHADSFSVYVIFDTNQTSTTEPTNMGTYGWIRFGGDVQKADSLPATPGFDNAGWMRYLKINIYTLNRGADPSNFNSYTYQKSFEHLATWSDSFTVESSQLGGTVKMTGFRKAGESAWQQYSGLETSYAANQYYQAWSPLGFSGNENELNIYLDTSGGGPAPQPSAGTRYIVRYYHADGSYDQEDGTLTQGQSFSFAQGNKDASGETYSGVSVTAGTKAASVNAGAGEGTISYDAGTRLVKVNVYYKTQVERKSGGTVPEEYRYGKPQYDAEVQSGTKVYDTSRDGLHTDKTAAVHGNDGRTFDLTLESWNIDTNMANVGMVFDASGSMVWTSNTPEAITKTPDEWRSLIGWYTPYKVLSDDQVNAILDTAGTDNSKLNYNDYKYYLYDVTSGINEYVPMGYSDGTVYNGHIVMDGQQIAIASRVNTYNARGWYYINSSGYTQYTTQNLWTAKEYEGITVPANTWSYTYSDGWNQVDGSTVDGNTGGHANFFYIDGEGNLKVCYQHSKTYEVSKVYQKADGASTKSEVLQDSVAKFASTLNSLSPESQVSMVRFSRQDFSSAELALLNWTNDTTKMTAAMNQLYGNTTTMGGAATANVDGMTVYNYGITGSTHTYKGIEAFRDDMTYGTEWHQDSDGQWRQYAPKTTNSAASKYLIIFTDGKDNSKKEQQSKDYATALKNNGYTIITVLMRSSGMPQSDVDGATTFLRDNLASDNPKGGKYFYSVDSTNGAELAQRFEEIARDIAKPLQGYTVTDYIDPRFDLLDPSGKVLTTLNEDGTFTEHPVKLSDGKTATLKYDSNKKMFYLEWTNQEIPTTTKGVTGADKVSVWSSTITVRAKDDFLGGNNILTNGNEAGQNRVYDPSNGNNPQKDFPKTTANPKVLGLSLGNYEDTIFKGEDIDPGNLYDKIAATANNTANPGGKWYLDYLKRIGVKDNKDYVAQLKSGETVKVDYYYLPEPGDATSYAGGSSHQNDKVGTLTYKWVADNTGGNTNSPYQTYTTTTINDVRYHLEVTYQPDAVNYGTNDQYTDNGTPRTLTLTGQSGTDKLIRDPVGTEQTTKVVSSKKEGIAVIHAVDGRIKVEKKVNKDKLLDFLSRLGSNDEVTFSLTLQRSYKDQTDTSNSRTIQVKLAKESTDADTITYDKVKAKTPDANGDVTIASQWQTGLPIGDYTLAETIQGTGFGTPTYRAVATNAITDDPSTTDYVEKSEFAAAFTQGDSSIVWHVGQVVDGVPNTCSYGNSDFSYDVVTDNVKQVDPKLAADPGKNYLNAQIGQAAVTNHPLPNLDILKRAAEDHSHVLSNVEFKLYQSDVNWTEPNLVAMPMRTVTTDADGKASFNFLPEGYYLIYETRAATGYQAPEEPWRVQVSNGQVALVAAPSDSGYQSITKEDDRYPIDNAKAQDLPSTGGPGTMLMYLAGIVLLCGYALSLHRRRTGAKGGEA